MSKRYIITSRSDVDAEGTRVAAPPLTDADGVSVVARLDRGLLIDADESQVERLQAAGWRTKELRNAHRIRLFSYEIDTAKAVAPVEPAEFERERPEDQGPEINHLVQLAGPVQESWLAVLAERGVRIVEAVGPQAYFVRAGDSVVNGLAALPFVEWTGPLRPAYKVNPVLLEGASKVEVDSGLGPIEAVDVGVLADGDVDRVAALIKELGGQVQRVAPPTSDVYRSITAQVPTSALPAIAAHDDVRWVDAVRAPVLEDERSAQIVYEDLDGVAAPNTAPNTGYVANLAALGADGASVTIAVCDTGVSTNDAATMHDDLAGRFAFALQGDGSPLNVADTDGHGTHVAGIAAGNGGSGDTDPQGFVLGQGVASGAQVGCVRNNGTRQERIQTSIQNGAQVMNNSYALDGDVYSAGDRTFDLGVRDADPDTAELTPLVIVFSAGNSGPGSGTLTKATKNAIVVGNSLNFRPGPGRRGRHPGPAQYVVAGTDR